MFKRIVIGGAAIAVASSVAFAASHIDPAIAGAVKARQSHMGLYAHNLGILGGMAKGAIEYDAQSATVAAENLATLAKMNQSSYWPQGSDTGSIENTRALAKIWEDFPGVSAQGSAMVKAADAMAAAAGTDLASLQGAIGPVGQACGACHKAYRQPE